MPNELIFARNCKARFLQCDVMLNIVIHILVRALQVCALRPLQIGPRERRLPVRHRGVRGQRWRFAQRSMVRIESEAFFYIWQASISIKIFAEFQLIWKIYLSRDNDRSSLNCASMLKGGWWWKSCGRGLNGLYLSDPQDLTARQGKTHPSTV